MNHSHHSARPPASLRMALLRTAHLALILGVAVVLGGVLTPGLAYIGRWTRLLMYPVRRTSRDQQLRRRVGDGTDAFASRALITTKTRDSMALAGAGTANTPHLPVVIVHFESPAAAAHARRKPLYLRLQTFDTFFADAWILGPEAQSTHSEWTNQEPTPESPGPQAVVRYSVYTRRTPSPIVPVLSQPVAVDPAAARLRTDGTCTLIQRLHAPRFSYEASSRLLSWENIRQEAISPAKNTSERYLRLPEDAVVSLLNRRIDAWSSHTNTPASWLSSLRNRLREERVYHDVNAAPDGTDALSAFLEDGGEGNCRAFATTLTLLARSIGFPARIATGFCGGEIGADGNSVVFHADDLHAWAEVETAEHGWVTIEATPATTEAPPYAPRAVEHGVVLDAQAFPKVGDVLKWETEMAQRRTQSQGAGLWAWLKRGTAPTLAAGLLLSLVAAIVIKATSRSPAARIGTATRRRDRHPRFLRHFLKEMAKRGCPKQRGQTLREFVTDLERKGIVCPEAHDLVAYVYAVSYQGMPRSRSTEKELGIRCQ